MDHDEKDKLQSETERAELERQQSELSPKEAALSNLSYIRREMIDTMESISRIADRGSSTLILAIGGAMLVMIFMFRVAATSPPFNPLSKTEFVSTIAGSVILLIAGGLMRMYEFHVREHLKQSAASQIRDSGVKILSKSVDIAAELAKHEATPAKPDEHV